MSGAITVLGLIGSSWIQADLPWSAGWIISVERPTAEFVSLAGTVIRQGADKSITAGQAEYTAPVIQAQAQALKEIDDGCSSVFLSDGQAVYEAQMDAKVSPEIRAGNQYVTASFRIIRQVLP